MREGIHPEYYRKAGSKPCFRSSGGKKSVFKAQCSGSQISEIETGIFGNGSMGYQYV